MTVECPWPFSTREVVLDALAFDDIDESGVVAVLLNSCDCEDDERVPAIDHKFGQCTRVDFHGGFLFRAIPSGRRRVEESERNTRRRDDCFVYF